MALSRLPLLDPTASLKENYDRFEAFVTPPLHGLLGTEPVNQAFSLIREQILTREQLLRRGLEQYWDLLRLPGKHDHSRLAGQVVRLEAKVDDLVEAMGGLQEELRALRRSLGQATVGESEA